MEPETSNHPNRLHIGPDVVTIENDALVIYAKRPIRDWQVREFQRHAIHFQGEKYYLRQRLPAAPPFAMRYELIPWPADLHEESSRSFTYNESFVTERDRDAKQEQQRSAGWYVLLPLYPVLGFCWSGFKERVLWPIGFEPSSISSAATMLEFGFVLVDGILFGWLGGGVIHQLQFMGLPLHSDFLTTRLIDFAVLILVVSDCIIRCNQSLRGDNVPCGFLEWMFPFLRRKDGR